MKTTKKYVVAHPMQQHSYRTAAAFAKTGQLDAYITTVYYNKDKFLYKLLAWVIGKDNVRRMSGKRLDDDSIHVVQYCELLGLIYLFLIRVDKKKYILPWVYLFLTWCFGKKVANYCNKHNIDAVIMYDTTAKYTFEHIKSKTQKIKCVLDMSSIPAYEICNIIESEIEKSGKLLNSMSMCLRLKTAKVLRKNSISEIEYADAILCGSTYPEEVIKRNYRNKKIYVIPYGVDCEKFMSGKRKPVTNRVIRFLFVGGVEATKGIGYLLDAFKKINTDEAELILVGDFGYGKHEVKCQSNIKIKGFVVRTEMPKVYQQADVYIIPSLYEGFSQSLIEAMSSGLPVIATNCSGAKLVVRDYENGFIIPAGNADEITNKMRWYIQHRSKIEVMGNCARKSVAGLTWKRYEQKIRAALKEIICDETDTIY